MLQTVLGESTLNGHSTLDSGGRFVEDDEESIADLFDLLAPIAHEEGPKRLIVPTQQVLPRLIAEDLDQVGRLDDVREHEGLSLPPAHQGQGGRLGPLAARGQRTRALLCPGCLTRLAFLAPDD